MKTKVEFISLCDFALTSQQGKLSLIGLFDRIFVTATPSKYPRFFVVAIVKGEPQEEVDISFQLSAPSGKSILPPRSLSIKLGSNGKSNIITDVSNLVLPEIGTYKIIISDKTTKIAQSDFYVTKVDQNNQKQVVVE